jgi:general secretion pathway protein J
MSSQPVRRTQPALRGFTLIEVLVAMTIMAVMAAMAWQGIDAMVRARAIASNRFEQLLRVNAVLSQWEYDLNAVQNSQTSVPALAFNGATLTLTRRTTSGMQLVVWSLRNGVWQRWAGPSVSTQKALEEQWSASSQFFGNEAEQLSALTSVSEWQLYFYRDNAWTNAQSSAGTPSSNVLAIAAPPPANGASSVGAVRVVNRTTQPPLPQGVRLVLSFDGAKGLSGKVTRDIIVNPQ